MLVPLVLHQGTHAHILRDTITLIGRFQSVLIATSPGLHRQRSRTHAITQRGTGVPRKTAEKRRCDGVMGSAGGSIWRRPFLLLLDSLPDCQIPTCTNFRSVDRFTPFDASSGVRGRPRAVPQAFALHAIAPRRGSSPGFVRDEATPDINLKGKTAEKRNGCDSWHVCQTARYQRAPTSGR